MARRRSPRKKKLPEAAVKVTIESLAHDGRGVAHVDGKVIFIDEALPGEELEFIYTDSRKDYAEGRVETLFTRAPERVDAKCEHFGKCGGCSFQHVEDAAQISFKQALLVDQFQRIGKVTIPEVWEPLTGPHWGYRQKARMGVKYVAKKGRVLVGFRERRNQFLAEIESCKVMNPIVGEKLMALSEMIGKLTIKDKIPQIEVAIGDKDCVLAFRVLEPATAEDKEIMRSFGHEHKLSLCLQSKGPDTIVPIEGEPEVMLTYSLPDQGVHFRFKPAMFTQVNYEINRKMISRVMQTMDFNENDRVLDLFCGLGNFTLPIATKAGHVVGVEGDQPLVNHAKDNAQLNNLTNVEFFAADLSKDVSSQAWAQQSYNKVMLDPSRAGAADVLPNLKKWHPELIMYVSCNPSTLARDAGILVNDMGYTLVKAGVMDMFPQTGHVESIALFRK
ncbi:23S rRNA (uracil(1939)-C(5))-methyltransferase RlmD [methanotrophic endosymbiont of Bathymodiolus puteoserpentis (Logatchev)]|jgi:23S rRNA (uracil1939-C5)-methyltransferase|uniref:23S rRNA (uracil(1939)-C(5))-methyltransferase RlmD n=1 Tax=methanotrophic endosymbiont of Bathymodiolus puteoserpentis (Logatchev) TaxID=343235 RepID=UPI0013C6CD7C|nr:23S rRNA (uracil(1939)-C(5))-methyltransferase RlmD [methanotrophic endosymbiont of Bathymodiolus puteoserpentis (Logatchev)]SHE21564.1 23S rRNA (Uracil-5-)-methyltransferase RumA \